MAVKPPAVIEYSFAEVHHEPDNTSDAGEQTTHVGEDASEFSVSTYHNAPANSLQEPSRTHNPQSNVSISEDPHHDTEAVEAVMLMKMEDDKKQMTGFQQQYADRAFQLKLNSQQPQPNPQSNPEQQELSAAESTTAKEGSVSHSGHERKPKVIAPPTEGLCRKILKCLCCRR